MNVIANALSAIDIGAPVKADRLSIHPLRTRRPRVRHFLTLDEATTIGKCRITEVSGHGRICDVLVANDTDLPVLILHGEELRGAKQDRIVNVTVLVPPHSSLNVPVSCVEAGRWSSVSGEFVPSGRAHYGYGRRMILAQVTKALAARRVYRTNQAAIWQDIDAKCRRMNARSPTAAAAALYEHWNERLQLTATKIAAGENDVGAIFMPDGRVSGLELTDSPDTWQAVMPKLLPSYGLDALDESCPVGDGRRGVGAQEFLEDVRVANCLSYTALGLGEDIRVETHDMCGAALMWCGRIVHLVVFPTVSKQSIGGRAWQEWVHSRIQ